MSSVTPFAMDSALVSRSGFEGVGVETAEISFFARFFFEDLDSACVGRLLLIAADMMTAAGK